MMSTFFLLIRQPFPQLWLLRVQKELRPFVQSVLKSSLFKKDPKFTSPFAQLFFAAGTGEKSMDILVKRIQAQKAADYIRRMVFSQGKREFLSSFTLMELGLKCPAPVGYAINLNPFSRDDSLFICGFLPEAVHISHHMRTLSGSDRLKYLEMVAQDICLMFANNLLHKDLHLKNILFCPADPSHIYWIDNDLRKTNKHQIIKRKDEIIHRLLINVPFCSNKEKKFFIDELFSWLNMKKQTEARDHS